MPRLSQGVDGERHLELHPLARLREVIAEEAAGPFDPVADAVAVEEEPGGGPLQVPPRAEVGAHRLHQVEAVLLVGQEERAQPGYDRELDVGA